MAAVPLLAAAAAGSDIGVRMWWVGGSGGFVSSTFPHDNIVMGGAS